MMEFDSEKRTAKKQKLVKLLAQFCTGVFYGSFFSISLRLLRRSPKESVLENEPPPGVRFAISRLIDEKGIVLG